jgi:hypothetical protein
MIGIPAPTTGRTIGSTGIGGTVGIMASTMVLTGERTMTGMAVRIITIIDDKKGAQRSVRSMIFAEFSVAAQRPFKVPAIGTARYFDS